MRTVDKLDKIGADKVSRAAGGGLRPHRRSRPARSSSFIAITRHQRRRCWPPWRATGAGTRSSTPGLDELNTVTKYLAAFGVPEDNFAVDLTIARGLDYYTGTVYETTLLDHPEIGSVCSGGRYDNLAEYYTE